MSTSIRFLNKDDYSACVDVVIGQKDFIEKVWQEDYRNWIQPLSGWLHPEPYERLNGSYLNQNKRLVGTFYRKILLGFSGLICFETRSNLAIYTSRITNKKISAISSDQLYGEQLRFLFEWGKSLGKNNIFACHHPKISEKTQNIMSTYLPEYDFKVVSHYAPFTHAEGWDQQIMGYGTYPFPVDIGNWHIRGKIK